MSIKLIILCGLFAVALGFTLPGDDLEYTGNNYNFAFAPQELPTEDGEELVRYARSPQGSFGGSFGHSNQHGSSASLNYNHRIGQNFDAYAEASRNFKYNQNSASVGLNYRF